ncbi:YybH family protein [Formosa sp. S-31]|uniref:YybH family protein n=1 Tax=Formosa sp. S-31 TaxID=2790949 RepID=UPI003EB7B9F7
MNRIKYRLPLIVLLFYILTGCKNDNTLAPEEKPTDAELTALITKQVDSLYSVYQRFDYDWIEFYADNYTAIYPGSPIKQLTKDSLITQWKHIYKTYDVKLISRGRPTIIPSADMAVSYNTFNEIFINKETSDTIKNVGTYIINWKRQPDDSWKIVFETLQNH